jgi:hypothetical protein
VAAVCRTQVPCSIHTSTTVDAGRAIGKRIHSFKHRRHDSSFGFYRGPPGWERDLETGNQIVRTISPAYKGKRNHPEPSDEAGSYSRLLRATCAPSCMPIAPLESKNHVVSRQVSKDSVIIAPRKWTHLSFDAIRQGLPLQRAQPRR